MKEWDEPMEVSKDLPVKAERARALGLEKERVDLKHLLDLDLIGLTL